MNLIFRGSDGMKRRFFSFFVVFLAATCISAPPSQRVHAADEGYPAHVSATLNAVLDQAHKTFRKDAVIYMVEVQGVPSLYWLQISLFSPSNGATLTVWVGGPSNGQFSVGMVNPDERFRVPAALTPNFNIDLPDAMAILRKAGLKGSLGVTRLVWAGASGTPPVLAWSIRVAGGPIMFPLFVDAKDGKVLSWQRAMDPPNASDAQLRAAWDTLLHRNQPPNGPRAKDPWECVAEIQETGNCAP